ncbi:MAG: cyclic nucleotide-binding domain-containing protein [Chloroflexi bacterium]|nr:cyclic nucleotide-binding domain-containing protein [Chloroflexota bacterium]
MLPVERLQTIPLFAKLDSQVLARMAPLFHHARFKFGDTIYRQGDAGEAFYVLDNGMLRVHRAEDSDREQLMGYLTAPAFFGETSLLTGLDRDVTMDVVSAEAQLFVLAKSEFDALLEDYPQAQAALHIRPDVQARLARRTLPWLAEGEVVLTLTRRHWYALVSRLMIPAILTAALLALAGASTWVLPLVLAVGAPSLISDAPFLLVLAAVVWGFGSFAWHILDWTNDYYIVTNKRVAHTEQVALFFDEREEAPLEQVTNVLETVNGWAARLCGFCDLRVETAGDMEIHFSFAPRSARIRQQVFEQLDRIRSQGESYERDQVREDIRAQSWQHLAPDLIPPTTGSRADSGEAALARQASPIGPQLSGQDAENTVRPGSISSHREETATVPQQPRRWRKRSGLGKWINDWFGLRIEETDRITWRKHWFVLLDRIAEPALSFAIILAVGLLHLSGIVPLRVLGTAVQSVFVVIFLVCLWGLMLSLIVFWAWYRYEDWSNDVYRVTADRVVDVERSPFGLRERSIETTLDRVQNISFSKKGILANLFNFGDLIIETAGAGRLIFYNVVEPREASAEIFHRREAHRHQFRREQAVRERQQFLDWFMEYHRLVQPQEDVKPPGSPMSPGARSGPLTPRDDSKPA